MIKDSELIPKKQAQEKEDVCTCGCLDQETESEPDNSILNKKIDRKNSCC